MKLLYLKNNRFNSNNTIPIIKYTFLCLINNPNIYVINILNIIKKIYIGSPQAQNIKLNINSIIFLYLISLIIKQKNKHNGKNISKNVSEENNI